MDDEEISRTAAARRLGSLGLVVEVATSGKEAVEMSARWPYVAIFMDCEMPEVDGYTARRQLHRRERFNVHAPVIAVTSRSPSVSFAAGMDHHITKPVQIDALRADCIRFGLLASERKAGTAAVGLGTDVPLLDESVLGEGAAGYRGPKLGAAAAFIEQATARLPELWRAANAADTGGLRRFALALKPLAESTGTARVSALCDCLSDAAAGRDVGTAVSLEEPLRQAVTDTDAAIRASADGAEPPAMPKLWAPASNDRGLSQKRQTEVSRVSTRVVLADDDPVARCAIAAMLKTADWIDIVGEADGVQGIVELVATEHPDVVVLDWLMPGGGGPEAARQILGQRVGTVIVAVTSSDSLEALNEMISAGASCLVSKGGAAGHLTQAIARALRASGVARAARALRVADVARAAGHRGDVDPAADNEASSPENTTDTAGPLDPAVLEQLRTDFESTGVLGELVELFRSQTPTCLMGLRHAIDATEVAVVGGYAHQLKGGCLTLAATRMARLCDELEQSSRAGSLDGATALVDQIEVAFEQAYSALQRELS